MKNLLRNSLIFFTLLSFSSAFAQLPDTVVVYEYVYQTDTVWIEQEPLRDTLVVKTLKTIDEANLIIDTIQNQASLVIFSSGATATIPINRIIYGEQHLKTNEMKKFNFCAILFMTLQSIAFAQPEISVKGGVTQFWHKPFDAVVDNSLIFGDHQGLEIKGRTSLKNFSLSVGYDQYGFGHKYSYSLVNSDGITSSEQHNDLTEIHRAIPLLIYYKIKRLELFAGYEYRFIKADRQINEYFSSSFRNEHALSAGVEYSISRKLSVYSKLYMGDIFVRNRYSSGYRIKNETCLDLSLKYYLFKNPSVGNAQ